MPQKKREEQAEYFGKEVKEIVALATGIDTYKLYKNYGETKTQTPQSDLGTGTITPKTKKRVNKD